MSNTADALRKFIKDNYLFGREPDFTDDESFLEMGLVDSTGVLELVTFLEGELGLKIADDELVPENLDSISRILKFVEQKKQEDEAAA